MNKEVRMRSESSIWVLVLLTVMLVIFLSPSAGKANEEENHILHVGALNRPESLNYFASTDLWSKRILRFFYMPLYIHDPITRKRIPWLAKNDPILGPDLHRVVIHLRDARWNDGSQVTSQDLIFTFKVIKKYRIPGLVEKWEMVRDIKALDKKTVEFWLESTSAIFFTKTLFTSFVQKKLWESFINSLEGESNALEKLMLYRPRKIGSNGPFYLEKDMRPLFLMLKRNPYFFGSGINIRNMRIGPYINGIFFEFFNSPDEATGSLDKGDTDFLWWDIPCDQFHRLKNKPNLFLYSTKRRGFDYLGFNLRHPPFDNQTIRKAIGLLIDRKKLVSKAIKGNGTEAYTFVPPEDIFWWNPNAVAGVRDLDGNKRLIRAKELLNGKGFKWNNKLLVFPNGRKMETIEILTTCADRKPYRSLAALMIKKNLSDLGIPSKIRMIPFHRLMDRLRHRKFTCFLMGWGNLSGEPLYLRTFFHSDETKFPGRNYFGFKNSKFDQLANELMEEVDPIKRKDLVFEMQSVLAAELPCIPLYSRNKTEAVRTTRFRGWMPLPGGIGNLWSFLLLKPIGQ